jgi:cob(I)alamin adenosyltransferase
MKSHLGKIHIYTGEGEGKTRASLGLALRAVGHNYNVVIVQFMKGQDSGERLAAQKLKPNLSIHNFGSNKFIDKNDVKDSDIKEAKRGLDFSRELIKSSKPDILILDEILVVMDFGLLKEGEVIEFIDSIPKGIEIVLTGRGASKKIIKKADLVTEMKEVKHYYKKGVQARKGIEY